MRKIERNETVSYAHVQAGDAPGLPKHCKYAKSNVTQCLFPQYFADEIETRLFPLQSIYDPLQKGKDPQSHGVWLQEQINKTVLSTTPKDGNGPNGAWMHSCERREESHLLTFDHVAACPTPAHLTESVPSTQSDQPRVRVCFFSVLDCVMCWIASCRLRRGAADDRWRYRADDDRQVSRCKDKRRGQDSVGASDRLPVLPRAEVLQRRRAR